MFLEGSQILKRVRGLLADAPTAKIAVAYWGKDAFKQLGLGRRWITKPQIICDLLTGGTNPDEIAAMMRRPALRLRHLTYLHAKVYWTPTGCVIGSANASTNGLGLEGVGTGGLVEAAYFIEDPDQLKIISRWFDQQWQSAANIGADDLAIARERWTYTRNGRIKPPRAEKGIKLLGVPLSDLKDRGIYVTVYNSELSPTAENAADAQIKSENGALDEWECYEVGKGWQSHVPLGSHIIDCKVDADGSIDVSSYFCKVPDEHKVQEFTHKNGRTGKLVWVDTCKTIEHKQLGTLRIRPADRRFIANKLKKLKGERKNAWWWRTFPIDEITSL